MCRISGIDMCEHKKYSWALREDLASASDRKGRALTRNLGDGVGTSSADCSKSLCDQVVLAYYTARSLCRLI
jgi:hypothetical protein